MENQNNGSSDNNRDAQGAEEFRSAEPNINQNPDHNDVQNEPKIPENFDCDDKKADTDPNRYAKISNPSDTNQSEGHDAGHFDRSDYKEGDQPVPNEPTHYATDDERRLSAETKHRDSDDNEDKIKSLTDKQQFFDGL